VGYDPQWVRFMMVALSGFFAGRAGGLAALNYEIVSSESLSAYTSGLVLLATYLGGIRVFAGPIAGAIAVTLMQTVLASLTTAWPFYFGLVFLATVLFVPGGIAGIVLLHKRLWDLRLARRAAPVYARMALPVALVLAAGVLMVEMAYRASSGVSLKVAGWVLDTRSGGAWVAAVATLVAAYLLSLGMAGAAALWLRRAPRGDDDCGVSGHPRRRDPGTKAARTLRSSRWIPASSLGMTGRGER
jgi:branched-chain amino acid transport system permease protein